MNYSDIFGHGGNLPAEFQGIDFSVNLNPMGMPIQVREIWQELLRFASRYPTPDGSGVRLYYQNRYDLPPEAVLPLNGAIEGIYLAPRVFNPSKILIPEPSFSDYRRSAEMVGAKVVTLLLSPQNNFAYPEVEDWGPYLEGVEAAWIASPNNPTGSYFSAENILRLSELHPGKFFFVDEAFLEFCPSGTTLLHPDRLRPNIIVFSSLTKLYALPGLRIGGCISHPGTINLLKEKMSPWSMNAIAESIAPVLAGCDEYESAVRTLIREAKPMVKDALESALCVEAVYGEMGPYLLFKIKDEINPEKFHQHMQLKNCHLRECANFFGLEENWFRVGIKLPKQNEVFIEAIHSINHL